MDEQQKIPQSETPVDGQPTSEVADVSQLQAQLDTLQKQLADVRREAASRRVANRELSTERDGLTQSVQTLLQEIKLERDARAQAEAAAQQAANQAARLTQAIQLAAKYNLPATLASRLQGDTPDALEADAKALAESLTQARQPRITPANAGTAITPDNAEAVKKLLRGGGGFGKGGVIWNKEE